MGAPRHRRSIAVARLLLCLTLLALGPLLLAPHGARAAGLSVKTDSATIDFPKTITFHLVADAPGPVARVELRYRQAFAPVTEVARPDYRGGQAHVDVTYPLDMRIHYLAPGVDVVYRWRVTLQDGSTLDTPTQTLFYMDNRYNWQKLSQGQVTLYYYAGGSAFGREALQTIVRGIERYKSDFNVRADEPVRVVLYASNRDFQDALPPNSAEWIGGFTYPLWHIIVAGIQPGTGASQEIRRLLSHEVVHLVTAQVTQNPYNEPPPWLNEGLAVYFQEVKDPWDAPTLQSAVEGGRLISIRELNSTFPDDPDLALLSGCRLYTA
ncbi:MAG: hypothetical protein IRY97_02875, partial [Thermomicrobiaceae bacterium]|nr:hypothetical protein [Thermomicrobiaceae bacterium]